MTDNEVTNRPPSIRRDIAPARLHSSRLMLLGGSRTFFEALRMRLLQEADVRSVDLAVTVDDAHRLLKANAYDAVVAEVGLARELFDSGDDSAGHVMPAPVIVIGDAADAKEAAALFRLGAAGWVDRTSSTAVLMSVERMLLQGMSALPLSMFRQVVQELASTARVRSRREEALAALSEREKQVLELLEQGLGRREIASVLHVSPNTVRTHVQSILRRLNVHSALAATALVRSMSQTEY